MTISNSNGNDYQGSFLERPVRVWTGNFAAGTPVERLISAAELLYERWLEKRPISRLEPHITDEMIGALAQSLCSSTEGIGTSEWYKTALKEAMKAADFSYSDIEDANIWRKIMANSTATLSQNNGKRKINISIEINSNDNENIPGKELNYADEEFKKLIDCLADTGASYIPPLEDAESAKKAINTLRKMGYKDNGGNYWVPPEQKNQPEDRL